DSQGVVVNRFDADVLALHGHEFFACNRCFEFCVFVEQLGASPFTTRQRQSQRAVHQLMESSVWIGLRFFSRRRVFTLRRIDGAATEWHGREFIVKVLREEELARLRVAHKNLLLVKRLRVFYVHWKISVTRSSFFSQRAPETVNEVVRIDRIAVGPATVVSQVKSEFG